MSTRIKKLIERASKRLREEEYCPSALYLTPTKVCTDIRTRHRRDLRVEADTAILQRQIVSTRHNQEWYRRLAQLKLAEGHFFSMIDTMNNEKAFHDLSRVYQLHTSWAHSTKMVQDLDSSLQFMRAGKIDLLANSKRLKKELNRLSLYKQSNKDMIALDKVRRDKHFHGFFASLTKEQYPELYSERRLIFPRAVAAYERLPWNEREQYKQPEGWRGMLKELKKQRSHLTAFQRHIQKYSPMIAATYKRQGKPYGRSDVQKCVVYLWKKKKAAELEQLAAPTKKKK